MSEPSARMAEVQEELTKAVEAYWAGGHAQEEMAPMLQFFPANKELPSVIVLIAGELTEEAKQDVCEMSQATSQKVDAYAVAMISEGWATRSDNGERDEVMFAHIDARDGRSMLCWRIFCGPDGQRTIGERKVFQSSNTGMLAVLLSPWLKED